jgi:hypothetical protein
MKCPPALTVEVPSAATFPSRSIFRKIVRVDFFHFISRNGGCPNAVIDEKVRQSRSVNQDDFVLNVPDIIRGWFRKLASRDENAGVSLLSMEGSDECLNFLAPHLGIVPSLCLKVARVCLVL